MSGQTCMRSCLDDRMQNTSVRVDTATQQETSRNRARCRAQALGLDIGTTDLCFLCAPQESAA